MSTFALELVRIDGRNHTPKYSSIPSDSAPADELAAFLTVMDKIHAPHHEMTPGKHAVHITDAKQIWSVRIVTVGDPDETQEMVALELDANGSEVSA